MKQGQIPRGRRYNRVLKEYEQHLKARERNDDIKADTVRQYLNDANRVLKCLLAASSEEDMNKITVGQQYKGYYGKVIRRLKAIMASRTL